MTCKDCGAYVSPEEPCCSHCGGRVLPSGSLAAWLRRFNVAHFFIAIALLACVVGLLSLRVKPVNSAQVAEPIPMLMTNLIEHAQKSPPATSQQPHSTLLLPAKASDEQAFTGRTTIAAGPARQQDEPEVERRDSLDSKQAHIPASVAVHVPEAKPMIDTRDASVDQREEAMLSELRNGIEADVQNLDFTLAHERIQCMDAFTSKLATRTFIGLKGQVKEAESFHRWLSKEAAGFRFSRGGTVERSDVQEIRFTGNTMPWKVFYDNQPQMVGDLVNNLILQASGPQKQGAEAKAQLLVQTAAFLALRYPDKTHTGYKVNEILTLLLRNSTNQTSKICTLFPGFYESYTNGSTKANLQDKGPSRKTTDSGTSRARTEENYLETREGRQATQVAVERAFRTSGGNENATSASGSAWKKHDLRSYDARHPRNKR